MQQIVECVPNFSNGRHPDVYNSLADAIRGVNGVRVLNVSADEDHHRTVITYVGKPADVEEAAFRAIALAAKLINLDEHSGEHPRIGATDVFPFVPVKGVTEEECVALAHRLGRRVGEELGIAVYLYGSAATKPDRVKLSAIRKGEYEQWKAEIGHSPERTPDYGPAEAKPCGATVIGVRPFLIAYNIYLNSDDVAVADRIARAVRFTNGGLRFVQAKGFLVDGQAQVSMNLTDFSKTPVHQVQEMVGREASRYGLTITKAELVGLIPERALLDAAKWYLQLHELQEEQLLEHRLSSYAEAEMTLETFLETAASAEPTPGGGSVAALAGALGAALTQMVAGLTVGRKKYADIDGEARAVLATAADLRRRLSAAIQEDAAAFDQLMHVIRDKQLDGAAKATAIQEATLRAAEVPLQVARHSREVATLAQSMAKVGNVNAVTDAAAAAIMASASVQAAVLNVKVNLASLQDQSLALAWREEAARLEMETSALADAVTALAAQRGSF